MVVHSIIDDMKKQIIYMIGAFCAWAGVCLQAQDVHPVYSEPITARILVDSLAVDSLANDSLAADSVVYNIWNDLAFASIQQPRYVRILAEGGYLKVTPGKQKRRKIISANPVGYRLEIYQSNDQRVGQNEANRLRAMLTGKVTVPIYVRFYTPFWRVRLGDFRTLEEANKFKQSFIQRFPGMSRQTYVVRDHIKAVVIQRPKEDK